MKTGVILFTAFIMAGLLIAGPVNPADSKEWTFTVLYDNYIHKEGTKADWGFACLIEGGEKTVLLDTGTNPEILMHNIRMMNVNLQSIDAVVITHDHGDHTGGLGEVLKANPRVELYLPVSFAPKYARQVNSAETRVIAVEKPMDICPGMMTTGEMGTSIKEQSLILDSDRGLVIVTGCSHQGIVNILKRAKEVRDRPLYLVFGGFHLMQHTDDQVGDIIAEFKTMGVEKCGATHCTGDRQIALFKDAFADHYVPIGTGRILKIGR